MKPPKVTVLMPVYNGGGFLAETIESILAQTFRDFEFLIIDDGSTDKSPDIIKKFSEQDRRIKVISRKNAGLVATLNEGLSEAQGEYIARQDQDDVSAKKRLEKQVGYLENNPSIGLLGTNLRVIDVKGNPVPRNVAEIDLLTSPDDLKLAEVFSNQFGHGSTMFRRETLKFTGDYDGDYEMAEDYDLWARFLHISKAANLKEQLYIWRLHKDSMSKNAQGTFKVRGVALKIRHREFQYYLTHKSEYRFFSFHPFSMKGGLRAYLTRKNSVYRSMALMYSCYGLRRLAVPILLLAIIHAPLVKTTYRQLTATLKSAEKARSFEHELF